MYCRIYLEDIDTVKIVIDKSIKSLEKIEKEFLELGAQSDHIELLNHIYEYVRCIKRESSFLGLAGITRLTYEMESVIDRIKNCKEAVGTEIIDTFLSASNLLKALAKRLNEELKDYMMTDKRTETYIEFSNTQNENALLDSFKLAREKYENEVKEKSLQRQAKESAIQTDYSIVVKTNEELQQLHQIKDDMVQKPSPFVRQEESNSQLMKSKSSVVQSIRVNQDKIDKMMNVISELIIAKNSFTHISEKLSLEYNLPEISKEVKQVGAYVNRISDELQNSIMSIRMVEVKTIFQKMPRVIRDIAQSTGKKMELILEGENTEIDKSIIEQISDPLVHLIRNSADHGIENLEQRRLNGKPETGRIVLRAYNKNKYVFIEIEDDGKGIDSEKIKKKALEKGIISENEAKKMDQKQLINLIFVPGFSMAKEITEVSGRGVGMDIVKSNISKINGNITIESEVDKGTKMIIRLPLSLAVSRGLIVQVIGETYIIPLENVIETVKINKNNIHKYNGKYFTYLRGSVIGMEWLCKIFLMGERRLEDEELNAVILSNGTEYFAIIVDKLKNEQEFVVKTLEGHLSAIPGIAGSTLLGNGQVVLIINSNDVLQLALRQ